MFAIESLHIGITFRFVWALMLAVIGFLIVYYIGSTIIAKKSGKDLSYRLKQWWHILLLKSFNVWGIRVLLISLALCGSLIGFIILHDLISAAMGTGLGFEYLPFHNYLPNPGGLAFLLIGLVIQALLGNEGMPIPIGNGLTLSYDKGAVLAFHLDESSPDLRVQELQIKKEIARLRLNGHNNEIRIKSWLCVSRLPRDNAAVRDVRHLFSEPLTLRLFLSRKMPRTWAYISTRKWYNSSRSMRPLGFLNKLINTFMAAIYTLINARKIRKAINCLPKTHINQSTIRMMNTIRLEMGEVVSPINVAPVSILTFMNLSLNLPSIRKKFMGLDAGFTVTPK